jgi:hypothetical protein
MVARISTSDDLGRCARPVALALALSSSSLHEFAIEVGVGVVLELYL